MRALVRRRQGRDGDDGAVAFLVAAMSLVLFACAALAVDYTSLVMERQKLHDTVDAAAHAGAFELPTSGANAKTWALNMAKSEDPTMDPSVELFCVVASTGASKQVAPGQIPSTCDPGNYASGSVRCNTTICSIPCPTTGKCNTVKVSDSKAVDFAFAPAIGTKEGDTGSVASAACKGSCGELEPNPMDVVFMADRTRSMQDADRTSMKTAILETLKTMTPSLHYVAFGALHKTATTPGSCATTASTSSSASSGEWVPLDWSKNYLTSSTTPTLNYSDPLVGGINCLAASPSHGTHLAAAFKGAAKYLLETPTTSLGTRSGTPKKVLIFETDGMPDETMGGGYQGLGNSTDFGAGSNGSCKNGDYYSSNYRDVSLRNWCKDYQQSAAGENGCDYLARMAAEAKAKGVTVITVGFGQAATGGCTVTNKHNTGDASIPWRTGGTPVREALAKAASPHPETGAASTAGDCTTSTGRATENGDGDFFFCAASGTELGPIFKTAIAQVSSGVRLLQLP